MREIEVPIKKVIMFILLIILLISLLYIEFKDNKYDVNNDGKVNSQDLFEVKNYIMEKGE
jgi:hypothetical protein